jgi:hypothetical protein
VAGKKPTQGKRPGLSTSYFVPPKPRGSHAKAGPPQAIEAPECTARPALGPNVGSWAEWSPSVIRPGKAILRNRFTSLRVLVAQI